MVSGQWSESKLITGHWSLVTKKGFTLIELLVAASILGIIGLVILSTFASGFHVFERVQAFGGAQADVLLAMEEMERDIKNMFPSAALPFEGSKSSITFPAIVERVDDENEEELVASIGRISYYIDSAIYLDDSGQALLRGQQDYPQAVNGTTFGEEDSEVLASISSMAFEYFAFNEESGTYAWQGTWDAEEENLLAGIKASVVYKDGEQDVTVTRSIFIPTVQKIFPIEEDAEEVEGEGDDDDDGGGETGE